MPIEISPDPCKNLPKTYGLYYILNGRYNLYMGAASLIQAQYEINYIHTFKGYELILCEEYKRLVPLTQDEITQRIVQERG